MEFKISVFTKPGEVLVLLYHEDCQKVESMLKKLKSYKEVNPIPLPCPTESKSFQFLLEEVSPSGDSVKVYPQIHSQEVKRIKPGSPIPLTFNISSQEEGDFDFQLVVKDEETTIHQQPLQVKCSGSRARITGGGEKNIGMSFKGTVDSFNLFGGKQTIGGSHQYNQQYGSNPQNEAETSQGSQYNIKVDNRKTNIAGKMATHGGRFTSEEHGASNPMHVKLPGSPD